MKNLKLNLRYALIGIAMVAVFSSCSKDDGNEVMEKNIVQVASESDNFSILEEALIKAGLTSTLQSEGPFTVFAPTNAAFNDLFKKLGVKGIADLSAEALKPILLNHVVGGNLESTDLQTGYYATANNYGPSGSKVKLFVNKGSSVMIDESKVVTANIKASNGVIHAVDKVILPPSVVNHAINNPDFSILVQAVVKAGLVDALSAAGPFTVFAPTNAAFTSLFATLGVSGIADLTAEQLTPILLYHVVSGNVTASQVSSGNVPSLKEGSNLALVVNSMGVKINNSSNVIATDVQATNGVIHAIDAVLIP